MPSSVQWLISYHWGQYFICPVSQVNHRGQELNIAMGPQGKGGEVTNKLKSLIGDIMYGRQQHQWAVAIPEKDMT